MTGHSRLPRDVRGAGTDAAAPTVLVYRDDLLPLSERFVVEPLTHLRHFRPIVVGSRRLPGTVLPVPSRAVTDGRLLPEKAIVAAYRWRGSGRLVRDLRRTGPRLVHAHFGVDAVQAMPLARSLRVPLVTTFHGYDVLTRPERLAAGSYRGHAYVAQRGALAREGALFVAVSAFLRGRLLDQGFPPERTVVHYIGVDTQSLSWSGSPRSGVLFVGRLVPYKGARHVLEAFARSAARERTTLTVVGDGPERGALQRFAADQRLPVRFLGAQPHETVRAELDRAAVFCSASHEQEDGACEALGLVNVEAQAMGLPVVGYADGGIPEAVEHRRTGLLVPPGDVSALAAALDTLLRDDRLRAELGGAARARVERRFDVRRQTAALERLYAGLAS